VTGGHPSNRPARIFRLVPEDQRVGALTIEENLKFGVRLRADKHKGAGALESVYREFPSWPLARTPRPAAVRRERKSLHLPCRLMTSPAVDGDRRAVARLAPRKSSSRSTKSWCGWRAQRKLTLLIVEQVRRAL